MASKPTTGRRPRKFVRFSDDANIQFPSPNERHDRSPSAASDDSDETIRPERPSSYIHGEILHPLPDSNDFNSSRLVRLSYEDHLHITNTPSLLTPLLGRQVPSPLSPLHDIENQSRRAKQSAGYGTMVAPPARRRTSQETLYGVSISPSQQLESQRYIHQRWQSFWRWLRGASSPSQIENESELATSEEADHRSETAGTSRIGRRKRIIKRVPRLASRLHGLGNPGEQLTMAHIMLQTAMSLSLMLMLAMVVFAIVYRVHKLATMCRSDR